MNSVIWLFRNKLILINFIVDFLSFDCGVFVAFLFVLLCGLWLLSYVLCNSWCFFGCCFVACMILGASLVVVFFVIVHLFRPPYIPFYQTFLFFTFILGF